jgi:dipeptidyl aminopeptidase/acylaminoacyl peptidase
MNAKNIMLILITVAISAGVFIKIYQQREFADSASQVNVTIAPFGAWESALTAASIFEGADNVSDLSVEDDRLYFIVRKASANGRNILVRLNENSSTEQLTSSDISVRSRVHEYGGRPYSIDGDDIYYSQFSDQKIYKRLPDGEAQALTIEGLRYMECLVDHEHSQLICVREDHRGEGEAVNTLVRVSLTDGGEGEILFQGTDFVHSPQLSPDEKTLAFITWSHPNMRWDDTQLRILTLADDGSAESVLEVPQAGKVSIRNPRYSENGSLYFVADFENWWTLYRLDEDGSPLLVLDQEIEIGSYGFESDTEAVITYSKDGLAHLARVDLATGKMVNIGEALSKADSIAVAGSGVYFRGSTPDSRYSIYKLKGDSYEEVYTPDGPAITAEYLSTPQYFTFSTGINEEAYGFYYPPKNPDFEGPDETLPPLIVKVHGGPVGSTSSTLDPSVQFWTSRGFAVFDVNHRGSTGYGRAFRKMLYPNWGIVDIEDVSNGVKWLSAQGYVDADKVAIRGRSAGGYTALAAMAFQDTFKAGTSWFGVSDLEALARDTHKYESRYLDQLVGPYPEKKDVYIERSPINSVDKIGSPLLLLQGLDDEVVPPNQSQMIFDALKENCIPTAYLAFAGEGHGFRQPANNIKALNAELDFFGQIFGFLPAGNIERIHLVECDG